MSVISSLKNLQDIVLVYSKQHDTNHIILHVVVSNSLIFESARKTSHFGRSQVTTFKYFGITIR